MKTTKQIAEIVRAIEIFGHATLPVQEVLKGTAQFLDEIQGTYTTFLPAHSINYVICRSAPEGRSHESCTVDGLGDHNRYRW
jgi:hypothetical protein